MKSIWHWKIKMQLTMDDTNMEWLDQKSPINHPHKGFNPINMLLPQLISQNPIFGPKLEETCFLDRKSHYWMQYDNVGKSLNSRSWMEILVTVVEYTLCASTSTCNMLNVNLQSLQGQKIQSLKWVSIYLRPKNRLVKPLIKSSIREFMFWEFHYFPQHIRLVPEFQPRYLLLIHNLCRN
jgi:hypothetical protein